MPNRRRDVERPVQATTAFSTSPAADGPRATAWRWLPAVAGVAAGRRLPVVAARVRSASSRSNSGDGPRCSEFEGRADGRSGSDASSEIAEEALTLKETGKKSRPRGPSPSRTSRPEWPRSNKRRGAVLAAPLHFADRLPAALLARGSARSARPAAARNIRPSAWPTSRACR